MKNFFDVFKTGTGAAALLLILPPIVFADVHPVNDGTPAVSGSVHKISHSLAATIEYPEAPNYKWGERKYGTPEYSSKWAKNDVQTQNYKWSVAGASTNGLGPLNTFAGDAGYTWNTRGYSEQTGYKWGFRSYADQAGYKWGFRSYADQAGYKWGFRSYADQAGYKWGFRSYADQAAYKWGFRSYADQAGYKWGFR